ncbi:hypothetical protein HNQ56_000066 [Anaerotaenia torta]|uniref:hypothetical protein n=1 Tax=Anaerotaenia torta TaxID=433293 RepID=UPI003D20F5A1
MPNKKERTSQSIIEYTKPGLRFPAAGMSPGIDRAAGTGGCGACKGIGDQGNMRYGSNYKDIKEKREVKASLTVEAALVLPVFLFAILSLLYLIQIITVQEFIQAALTKMGLNMAKTAYVYEDFAGLEEALNFDGTIFDTEMEAGLGDFAKSMVDRTILKQYGKKYLDVDRINRSCIRKGFEGISFSASEILQEEDTIDIIVHYRVAIPVRLITIGELPMMQRIRVRAWTGHRVAAAYELQEEAGEEETVYITENGSVYHVDAACSHIRLSVSMVSGIPAAQRNSSGGKYYPCESCCEGEHSPYAVYYITSDGTRYHTRRDCSGIKRTVKAIPRSEAGSRPACKRCGASGEGK